MTKPRSRKTISKPKGQANPVTIADLEAILDKHEDMEIEIQCDGSIKATPKGTAKNKKAIILTAKYAAAEYY